MPSLWTRLKLSLRSQKSKWEVRKFGKQNAQEDETMDPLDRVLENKVGSHGFWQWFILVIGVIGLPTYEMFTMFGISEQYYRCRMPEPVENILHNLSVNEALDVLWGLNATERAQIHNGNYPDQCYHRLTPVMEMSRSNRTDWTKVTPETLSSLAMGEPVRCSYGYIYEPMPNQYPTSVVASFDLVCDRAWLGPLNLSMLMFGMLFGFYVGGWAGDHFGRRPTMITWFIIFIMAGYLASFAPNVICMCLAQFLLGAADSARTTVLFVQIFEMTTARWRSVMGSSWTVIQSFGARAFLALLAYLLPEWRWLLIGMTTVGAIGFLYICIGPESPRWLVVHGRVDEAVHVLQTGYRYNHCCRRPTAGTFTERDKIRMQQLCSSSRQSEPNKNKVHKSFCAHFCDAIKQSTFWELFRSREYLKRLILASLVFNCHLYSYFGVMLYGNKIRGVIYVVALINAATALPGTLISCILYRVFVWRKRPLLLAISIAFVCICFGAVSTLTQKHETDTLLISVVGIALIMLESSLDMIYVYIPELFPTRLRSKGLGFCAGCAHIAAAMVSYTNALDSRLGHGSPMLFYTVALFVAILAMFLLPDTRGENLDDPVIHTEELPVLCTEAGVTRSETELTDIQCKSRDPQ